MIELSKTGNSLVKGCCLSFVEAFPDFIDLDSADEQFQLVDVDEEEGWRWRAIKFCPFCGTEIKIERRS